MIRCLFLIIYYRILQNGTEQLLEGNTGKFFYCIYFWLYFRSNFKTDDWYIADPAKFLFQIYKFVTLYIIVIVYFA